MWRVKIQALLVQRLVESLIRYDKLPESISEDEKEELKMKTHRAIQLYLANEVLLQITDKDIATSLWLKLENLYIAKS